MSLSLRQRVGIAISLSSKKGIGCYYGCKTKSQHAEPGLKTKLLKRRGSLWDDRTLIDIKEARQSCSGFSNHVSPQRFRREIRGGHVHLVDGRDVLGPDGGSNSVGNAGGNVGGN
ncbi:hypothetical protein FVEG_12785 [Fusarium verticillioides 7600]|uniref:Uncharacterized protein n=1 Tax=Gibberella moniliformis (strain M3125 / FGSC 7600) TaxID=334819 RepID=W7N326_GIBM7|nr:hypothetical protein FVEG_12785 [Fusarium verticillioides 7600]EWG54610.1 hypothetical protein FVEG_12785 [Fusarium verticillioides 7600]